MIRIRIGWFYLSRGGGQFYKRPSSATKEPGSSLCFLMFRCTTQPAFSARGSSAENSFYHGQYQPEPSCLSIGCYSGEDQLTNEMVKPKNSITERRETDNNRTKMRPLSKAFDSTGCQHFHDIIYQTVETIVRSENNRLLSNTCFWILLFVKDADSECLRESSAVLYVIYCRQQCLWTDSRSRKKKWTCVVLSV